MLHGGGSSAKHYAMSASAFIPHQESTEIAAFAVAVPPSVIVPTAPPRPWPATAAERTTDPVADVVEPAVEEPERTRDPDADGPAEAVPEPVRTTDPVAEIPPMVAVAVPPSVREPLAEGRADPVAVPPRLREPAADGRAWAVADPPRLREPDADGRAWADAEPPRERDPDAVGRACPVTVPSRTREPVADEEPPVGPRWRRRRSDTGYVPDVESSAFTTRRMRALVCCVSALICAVFCAVVGAERAR
jgi:hypothetical protein